MKKLENIRQDHEKRIEALKKAQVRNGSLHFTCTCTLPPSFPHSLPPKDEDRYKAELIECNTDIVDRACIVIRSAIASAMDWGDIELLVRDAQARGDPVANSIQGLKLHSNLITLWLK